MTSPIPPICLSCARYTSALRCEAYPDGIPEAIVHSEHDHRLPYEGDHGLRYVRDETKTSEFTLPENIFGKEPKR